MNAPSSFSISSNTLLGNDGGKFLVGAAFIILGKNRMYFVSFGRFRKKPTKEMVAAITKIMDNAPKEGVKFLSAYWTLGRFDSVVIAEAPNEQAFMKIALRVGEYVSTETLMAVPREKAIKLVG